MCDRSIAEIVHLAGSHRSVQRHPRPLRGLPAGHAGLLIGPAAPGACPLQAQALPAAAGVSQAATP